MRKLALTTALVFGFAMVGCSDDDSCVDVDGDGYGEGSGCLGTDCDDGDEEVWADMVGYADTDNDGEHAETSTDLCTDGTLPADYSDTAGTDCDDTNDQAIMIVQGYVDNDGDGYGVGDVMDVCGDATYLPPGYADNGDDCDDASNLAFTAMDLYPDADGDTVYDASPVTLCTDGTIPAGYSDTAGTDCDDADPYATNDASHGAMCTFKGTCVDTEMGFVPPLPDMFGIGACASVDCNGARPDCAVPMEDTGVNCVSDPTICDTGEICIDFTGGTNLTCWSIPGCCINDPAGLPCSELAQTCLPGCDVHLPDQEAYATCLQMDCFEAATPVAQQLYRLAQECAAAAGCFATDDFLGCAMAECSDPFLACMADS